MVKLRKFYVLDAVPGAQRRRLAGVNVYVPELTGLRGAAIIIVVLGHFFQRIDRFLFEAEQIKVAELFFTVFATPFTGCTIFFCVSGYSLMLFIVTNKNFHPAKKICSLIWYTLRRFIVIYPPYFFILVMTGTLLYSFGYVPRGTNSFSAEPSSITVSLVSSLTLTHTLIFGTFPRLFPPGWFIEVQFQFYLIGPIIWSLYQKLWNNIARVAFGIFVLMFCTAASLITTSIGPSNMQYSIIVFMPYFWLGAILADLRSNFGRPFLKGKFCNHPKIGWIAFTAIILTGWSPFGPSELGLFLQMMARLVLLFAIFHAASIEHTNFQRVVVNRWLVRAGVTCYSIYLVHLQILQILVPIALSFTNQESFLIVVLFCAFCIMPIIFTGSTVFYWLVERPFVAATGLLSVPGRVSNRTITRGVS